MSELKTTCRICDCKITRGEADRGEALIGPGNDTMCADCARSLRDDGGIVAAVWDGQMYRATGRDWSSADGDYWIDGAGLAVNTAEFYAVQIRLVGGKRNGELIG